MRLKCMWKWRLDKIPAYSSQRRAGNDVGRQTILIPIRLSELLNGLTHCRQMSLIYSPWPFKAACTVRPWWQAIHHVLANNTLSNSSSKRQIQKARNTPKHRVKDERFLLWTIVPKVLLDKAGRFMLGECIVALMCIFWRLREHPSTQDQWAALNSFVPSPRSTTGWL